MTLRPLLVAASFVAFVGAAEGCELVADFDRSKIPGPDASIDAAVRLPDAGAGDAGAADAGPDADDSDAMASDDAGADDGG